MQDKLKDLYILIVDDTIDNLVFLEQLLTRKGYSNIKTIDDSRQVLPEVEKQMPDMVLLDIMMPHFNGYEILQQIRRKVGLETFLPIIVLTAITDRQARQQALKDGATDFLTKPLDAIEVIQRVNNLLHTRLMYKQQMDYSAQLEIAVTKRTKELNHNYEILQSAYKALDESNIEIADRLARAAEFRDDATGKHTFRVGSMAALIAAELGLSSDFVELIRKAARLHDLGKIGIPDSILLKPAKLTEDEFEEMKKHSEIGAKLLSGGKSAVIRMSEKIALSHHERWDGGGYPHGLKQIDIPIEARIVSIVDVYDALTHIRPYKKAWTQVSAIDYITAQKGRQFDPEIVDAFLKVITEKNDEVQFVEIVSDPSFV